MNENSLTFSQTDTASTPLLTLPGGIGLYRKAVDFGLRVTPGQGIVGSVMLRGVSVRIGANGDGFIEQLVPGAQESQTFDLGLEWDSRQGLRFAGGAALEVILPLSAKLPIVTLQALHLGLKAPGESNADFSLSVGADLKGSLAGLIDVSVERMGLQLLGFTTSNVHPRPEHTARLGRFLDLAPRFQPPMGAGLALNLGVISGGGSLSVGPGDGQYAGMLTIDLLGLGVTAIGIVSTKPAFSLLAVITANFRPVGLDIGFGFTVNAVGGLLGLHRSIDAPALRDAVRTNALQSLLFPPNPVADAPRIISDMARVFPPAQDHLLIGPMIEMGWGKPTGMISLQLGVIVELRIGFSNTLFPSRVPPARRGITD